VAESLVLKNATLINGTGCEPLEGTTVVVVGDRISSVGTEVDFPAEASVVDLKGFTLMPGFIDCHVHLGAFVIDDPDWQFNVISFVPWFASFLWDYSRNFTRRRRLAIENGLTSFRSAGDIHPHILQLRDKIAFGKLGGPRIFAPGPIFTAPGGHPAGTIYRRNRYIVEHATRQVNDTGAARDEVRKLAEEGVDCIKAIYCDQNLMDLDNRLPKLRFDVLAAMVDEAHLHNLRIMVHTGNPDDTRDAANAGVDSIEHGLLPGTESIEFPDDVVKMMADRGTYYVPTPSIAWANRKKFPELFNAAKRAVKHLHEAGVHIAAGTDSGTPGVVIGKGIHIEMAVMVDAGLSPMEAIITGTRNAAENLGRGSDLGTLESGKLADMVVVSGNPLEEISETTGIRMVIKAGEILVNRLKI